MRWLRLLAPFLVVLALAACRGPQRAFTIPICDVKGGTCSCPISAWIICEDVCVDPRVSRDHCGGCGLRCPGSQVCLDGACGSSCGSATVCDGACAITARDPWNCGACGQVCDGLCKGGECASVDPRCAPGLTACNLGCTDLDHDPQNCGECDSQCPADGLCFINASNQHQCCTGTLCGNECFPAGVSCP